MRGLRKFNNKYGNKKTTHAGYSFDSKGESTLFDHIKLREKMGLCKLVKVQDSVYLSKARILYKPDFRIDEHGRDVWEEYKGIELPTWRIKRRLWMAYGPGLLRIYKSVGKKIVLAEEITPQDSVFVDSEE